GAEPPARRPRARVRRGTDGLAQDRRGRAAPAAVDPGRRVHRGDDHHRPSRGIARPGTAAAARRARLRRTGGRSAPGGPRPARNPTHLGRPSGARPAGSRKAAIMTWDFSTEPEFQEKLDWIDEFVTTEIEPIDLAFSSHTVYDRS